MVANTMSTFVSLTVHCARCHDHKFDPIPQKDYYRLQAVFAGVDRGDRPLGLGPAQPSVVARGWGLSRLRRDPRAARPIRLLRRGDVEQPGDVGRPGALACVPAPACRRSSRSMPTADEGSRRAALADWLASPANVLTWRSIVNRVWHYHFGRGIVDTPNDFGRIGSLPSHPELLDWLAVELLRQRPVAQGPAPADRHAAPSTARRRASDPAAAAIDADNRFSGGRTAAGSTPRRCATACWPSAGTLDRPDGRARASSLFRFKDDHSPIYDHSDPAKDRQPRRCAAGRSTGSSCGASPTRSWRPLDCADPNLNTPVRSQTLTALQALALWNDLFMVRQSQELARRLERPERDPARRIDAACLRALGRGPQPPSAMS